jgi:hypothetical protein
MLRRLLLPALVATGLVAGSFGTAHAATVPADTWAPKFCTALQEWQQSISSQSDQVTSELEGVTDLQTGREKIADLLGQRVDATATTAGAIKDAGSPSTPNGAKIQTVFVNGFKAISKEFAKAQAKAEKLSTTSPTAFAKQGKKIGTELSASGDELGKNFDAVDKLDKGKKLESAVKAAPECAFLNT